MKELDTKEMDSEEQELYGMLRSKFNPKEMKRLAILMIIDAEKYHQEKLNNNIVLGDVSGWLLFKDNTHLFGEAHDMNYWCKFEDGTECRYRDEHPFAKMTHFKID